jgi:hypothetical protein
VIGLRAFSERQGVGMQRPLRRSRWETNSLPYEVGFSSRADIVDTVLYQLELTGLSWHVYEKVTSDPRET